MAARKKDPPGVADPPEGPVAAKDGQPDESELERRRRAREEAKGTSVSERVEDDDPPELFPHGSLEGDPKVTLKNLIRAGSRVSVKASISSAEVPIVGGGLFDPEQEVTFLVRGLPGGVTPRPKHEGEVGDPRRPVKEWTLSQSIRAIHVEGAGEMVNRVQLVEVLEGAGVTPATVRKILAGLFGDEPHAGTGA